MSHPAIRSSASRRAVLVALILFGSGPASFAQGRFVVNHDEWTLSNLGFGASPPGSAALYVQNLASFLTNGAPGNFLALSTNFGLTESSLAAAFAAAGHTWTIWSGGGGVPQTAAGFAPFDAVFLAGPIPNEAANVMSELVAYVQNGGSVYLAGGASFVGGAPVQAGYWNPLLANFGFAFASTYNGINGVVNTNFAHPIFAGVPSLYFNNGNSVSAVGAPGSVLVYGTGANGLFGIYEPTPIVFQTNTPAATLTINYLSGTAFTPPPAGGATGSVQVSSSLVAPFWDVALTFSEPIVPFGAGGFQLSDGQIVNLFLGSPGFLFLNNGFGGGPLLGPIDLPYSFPVGSPAFSGQLIVLDPAAPLGLRLSAPARVEP
jgi:hypothetical protein